MKVVILIVVVLAVAALITATEPEASYNDNKPAEIVDVTGDEPLRTYLERLQTHEVKYSYIQAKSLISENVDPPAPPSKPNTGSLQDIKNSIIKWAGVHGVSSAWLLRIADCESTFNPTAVNRNYYAGGGNPTGLFQYLPETWSRIGGRSPYGVGDVFDYEQQAKVTAWAFANGYSGEWECR